MTASPLKLFFDALAPMGMPFVPVPTDSKIATYGDLEPEQAAALKPFIRGRRLRDYGCGNMVLDQHLLKLGARHIEAVDREWARVPEDLSHRLTFIQGDFTKISKSSRTAVVAWPWNIYTGVEYAIADAPRVIYVGRNTGGTACGSRHLWMDLLRRKVLLYVPDQHNVLIVYGERLKRRRRAKPEEYAAINVERALPYEVVHSATDWALPEKWKKWV